MRHRQIADSLYLKNIVLSDVGGKRRIQFPCHRIATSKMFLRPGDGKYIWHLKHFVESKKYLHNFTCLAYIAVKVLILDPEAAVMNHQVSHEKY